MADAPPRPTDAELALLRVLWSRGPSTVRQVFDAVADSRARVYTTVLKLLQIMTDKGLTTRESLGLQHVYTARRTEQDTQRQLVKDLLDRAFAGSTSQLVMQALATTTASPAELREIRRLLTAAGTAAKEKK
ncbi:MAG TPA: BlaI/MecI/CopY family transcriptional regulator [Pseudolysinimonas sp.]|jgi:BlaI family transcriptional regulator, penicillinase repressor|nr:BlaI/MecI/CopY family transcriptional regulator [Pseudolysinimonas sp.]